MCGRGAFLTADQMKQRRGPYINKGGKSASENNQPHFYMSGPAPLDPFSTGMKQEFGQSKGQMDRGDHHVMRIALNNWPAGIQIIALWSFAGVVDGLAHHGAWTWWALALSLAGVALSLSGRIKHSALIPAPTFAAIAACVLGPACKYEAPDFTAGIVLFVSVVVASGVLTHLRFWKETCSVGSQTIARFLL